MTTHGRIRSTSTHPASRDRTPAAETATANCPTRFSHRNRRVITLTGLVATAGAGLYLGVAATGAAQLIPQAIQTPATVLTGCLAMAVAGMIAGPVVARLTRTRVLPRLRHRTRRFAVAGAISMACWAPMTSFATSHSQRTVDNVYTVPLITGLAAAAVYWWWRKHTTR